MSLRLKSLVFAVLALCPVSALADTAYNNAIFVYEMNLKNANIQLEGASAFASLGNITDVCESLGNAIGSWENALKNLAKAEQAPADAADNTRLTPQQMSDARADIAAKSTKVKTIMGENCPASTAP